MIISLYRKAMCAEHRVLQCQKKPKTENEKEKGKQKSLLEASRRCKSNTIITHTLLLLLLFLPVPRIEARPRILSK